MVQFYEWLSGSPNGYLEGTYTDGQVFSFPLFKTAPAPAPKTIAPAYTFPHHYIYDKGERVMSIVEMYEKPSVLVKVAQRMIIDVQGIVQGPYGQFTLVRPHTMTVWSLDGSESHSVRLSTKRIDSYRFRKPGRADFMFDGFGEREPLYAPERPDDGGGVGIAVSGGSGSSKKSAYLSGWRVAPSQ